MCMKIYIMVRHALSLKQCDQFLKKCLKINFKISIDNVLKEIYSPIKKIILFPFFILVTLCLSVHIFLFSFFFLFRVPINFSQPGDISSLLLLVNIMCYNKKLVWAILLYNIMIILTESSY